MAPYEKHLPVYNFLIKLGIRVFRFSKSISAMYFFDPFFALNLNLAESKKFSKFHILYLLDKKYFGEFYRILAASVVKGLANETFMGLKIFEG